MDIITCQQSITLIFKQITLIDHASLLYSLHLNEVSHFLHQLLNSGIKYELFARPKALKLSQEFIKDKFLAEYKN